MRRWMPMLTAWALLLGAWPGAAQEDEATEAEVEIAGVIASDETLAADDEAAVRRFEARVRDAVSDLIAEAEQRRGGSGRESRPFRRLARGIAEGDDSTAGSLAVGAFAIFMTFGTPVLLVAAVLYANYRKRRQVHETITKYLDSGRDVPAEVWQGLVGERSPRSNLHRGTILLGLALGVVLCFGLMGVMWAVYLALIPLCIGLAQLLIWALERKHAAPGA